MTIDKESLLTYELACEMFEIVGSDLVWKKRPRRHFVSNGSCKAFNTKFSGKISGSRHKGKRDSFFYMCVSMTLGSKTYYFYCHRIAFLIHNGYWPINQIDHEDGDGLNNYPDNLRDVTNSGNQRNCSIGSNNTSGTRGVDWRKRESRWRARIKINGKYIELGHFVNKPCAISARKAAEEKHGFHPNHGRPARLTQAQETA